MAKASKFFIMDTNVLIDDPEAIFKMDEHNIILPDIVLEELDHFKTERSERGNAVKRVSRYLDELCKKGNLKQGISLGEGKGQIFLEFTPREKDIKAPFKYDLSIADNRILYLGIQHLNDDAEYIIITKDTNLRVKANSLGVPVESYKNEDVFFSQNQNKPYMGRTVAYLPSELLSEFARNKYLEKAALYDKCYKANGEKFNETVYINEFFELYSCDNSQGSCLMGRFDGRGIVPLRYADSAMHGIAPRNIGQYFMKEALLAPPDVAPLVIIKGTAGTGKTLFALAAGLENYANPKKDSGGHKKNVGYNKILICRPST